MATAKDEPEEPKVSLIGKLISLVKQVGLLLVISTAIAFALWLMFRTPPPTSSEQLQKALDAIKARRPIPALQIGIELHEQGFIDPGFAGGVDFVLGMGQFLRGRARPDRHLSLAQDDYENAILFLERAQKRSLPNDYRRLWNYGIGLSYFGSQRYHHARNPLNTVYPTLTDAKEQLEVGIALSTCHLDPNVLGKAISHPSNHEERKAIFESSLKMVDALLATEEATQQQLATLTLHKAKYHLRLSQPDEAIKSLNAFDDQLLSAIEKRHFDEDRDLIVVEASIAKQDYETAEQLARNLMQNISGTEVSVQSRCYYLLAQIASRTNQQTLALGYLEKPAELKELPESLPANLLAGDIARELGLHEAAIASYLTAMKQVEEPDLMQNPWIAAWDVRQTIHNAFHDWLRRNRQEYFEHSLKLAENMMPLFQKSEAYEMVAIATQRHAEAADSQLSDMSISNQLEQQGLVEELWRRAGRAYERLAEVRTSEVDYPDALWGAAMMYRRGKDISRALTMLEPLLAVRPDGLTAQALVFKGQLLIDLDPFAEPDNLEEAIRAFEQVIEDFPRDQAALTARLKIGNAYVEQGKPLIAAENWRNLLVNSSLTPKAPEWREALLRLGRVLFLHSDGQDQVTLAVEQQDEADTEAETPQDESEQTDIETLCLEAIQLLDQFVMRVPNDPEAVEARWLLARGLQLHSSLQERRLANSDTANRRQEFIRIIRQNQARSLEHWKTLRQMLDPLVLQDRLDPNSQQIRHDAYFQAGHDYFRLSHYDSSGEMAQMAIDNYTDAIHTFPTDPQILLIYHQVAVCYDKLSQPRLAISQLKRARVILSQLRSLPENVFDDQKTNLSAEDWDRFLVQAIEVREAALVKPVGTALN